MKYFLLFLILQAVLFSKKNDENRQPAIPAQEKNTFQSLINYENALLAAKKADQKLLIYFSSSTSVPCLQMEEDIFPDSTIKYLLAHKLLCFNANLDDRTALPLKEQYFSKIMGRQVATIGQKLQELQLSHFKANMVPYFVIIDPNRKLVQERRGRLNKKEFISFLNKAF